MNETKRRKQVKEGHEDAGQIEERASARREILPPMSARSDVQLRGNILTLNNEPFDLFL